MTKRRAVVWGAALVLVGCGPPPLVLSASQEHISVNVDPMYYSEQTAVDRAASHCEAYGKNAVLKIRTPRGYGAFFLDFNCE